jgi:hypothetical protein
MDGAEEPVVFEHERETSRVARDSCARRRIGPWNHRFTRRR